VARPSGSVRSRARHLAAYLCLCVGAESANRNDTSRNNDWLEFFAEHASKRRRHRCVHRATSIYVDLNALLSNAWVGDIAWDEDVGRRSLLWVEAFGAVLAHAEESFARSRQSIQDGWSVEVASNDEGLKGVAEGVVEVEKDRVDGDHRDTLCPSQLEHPETSISAPVDDNRPCVFPPGQQRLTGKRLAASKQLEELGGASVNSRRPGQLRLGQHFVDRVLALSLLPCFAPDKVQ
jgi:hypothetical protein